MKSKAKRITDPKTGKEIVIAKDGRIMHETMREIKRNIVSVRSALVTYGLSENQYFCETPKAYEIWEDSFDGEFRIHRLPKSRIFWITEK